MILKLSPLVSVFEAGTTPPRLAENQLALPCIPSTAFGDGSHPTTRLCAGAVDFHCRQTKPRAVLDVGTGTGILARIARARGAEFVVATDIDPEALRAAKENSALDRGAAEIIVSAEPPDHRGPRFDLVIANILEGPLRALAPSIQRALALGGTLMISGFTPLQIPTLRLAFESEGPAYRGESFMNSWVLLQFQKFA